MLTGYTGSKGEDLETMRNHIDTMPRPLALTLLVGSLTGSVFWAGLIALVIR